MTTWQGGAVYCEDSSPSLINCTFSGNACGTTATSGGGGIYCASSNPSILNTIIANNQGRGGIRFTNSLDASITYSDFYNNQYGNFYGIIPPNLGQIITVNANGDSCDAFYNIFADPQFIDSISGDFRLQSSSPCIDAGDPTTALDPDSTIADMGAFYFDQSISPPLVTITLAPYNPPIIIPANGGSFQYHIQATNTEPQMVYLDYWCDVTLPNGNPYGPVVGPNYIGFPGGITVGRDRTQLVPANAPAGMYSYNAYIGIYPDSVVDADAFSFEKLEVADGGERIANWLNTGDPFEGRQNTVEAIHPLSFRLHPCCPNPFNPTTTIRFDLPQAGWVKLEVFDVAGRLVGARHASPLPLVNGWREAGSHEVTFDGSGLPSGVYLAKLEAGSHNTVQKLVLLK